MHCLGDLEGMEVGSRVRFVGTTEYPFLRLSNRLEGKFIRGRDYTIIKVMVDELIPWIWLDGFEGTAFPAHLFVMSEVPDEGISPWGSGQRPEVSGSSRGPDRGDPEGWTGRDDDVRGRERRPEQILHGDCPEGARGHTWWQLNGDDLFSQLSVLFIAGLFLVTIVGAVAERDFIALSLIAIMSIQLVYVYFFKRT